MQTLQRIVDKITANPEMWVSGDKFETVAAFISGYDWGIQEFYSLRYYETELGQFRSWLADRFYESHSIARNLSWGSYIAQVWTDEADRLEQLGLLFHEWLSEREAEHPAV